VGSNSEVSGTGGEQLSETDSEHAQRGDGKVAVSRGEKAIEARGTCRPEWVQKRRTDGKDPQKGLSLSVERTLRACYYLDEHAAAFR